MSTVVSLVFVVVVIASIAAVNGHLGLRVFRGDDDVYASDCRHGRCAVLTHHRRTSGVPGEVRFDDMVVDAGGKPFGENDYDDDDHKAAARYRELENDRRIMTFPYCSTMNVDECRSLLRRLERLRLRRLRGGTKRNVVVTRVGGAVVRLAGRRRRSAPGVDRTGNKQKSEAPKTRAVRSHNVNAVSEANRLVNQYRAWRKENGYGRNYARWGRAPAMNSQEDGTAHLYGGDASSNKDSLMSASNGTANEVHHRTPRSVVVEIEPDEELPANERDMLDTYLAWRETHGYGTLAGRWG